MKRTTIYMDEHLKRTLQKLCIDLGIPMTSFIEAAIREKLEKEKKKEEKI